MAAKVAAACSLSAVAAGGCFMAGLCGGSGAEPKDGLGWKRGHKRHVNPSPTSSPAVTPRAGDSAALSSDAKPAATEVQAEPTVVAELAEWEQLKADGTSQMKNQEYAKAVTLYESAATSLLATDGDKTPETLAALAALHSNCSLARKEIKAGLEEAGRSIAASRLLPLIVLDCSRALTEGAPTLTVRCKALANRADALEEIDDPSSLMQGLTDMAIAAAAAKTELESATKKLETGYLSTSKKGKQQAKKAVENWTRNWARYEASRKRLFVKLLTARAMRWKTQRCGAAALDAHPSL